MTGWVLDKSAAVKANEVPVSRQLSELAGNLYVCPVGELEQLYSARSAADYEIRRQNIRSRYAIVDAPADVFLLALRLQRDLAHHHGMWHRIPIPDLLIAETALYHDLGVVTVDSDFERIAEVRPLEVMRLG